MKPHLICHGATSVDGRTLPSQMASAVRSSGYVRETSNARLEVDGSIIGRVTGSEFARGEAYSDDATEGLPRASWISNPEAAAYAIVLDAHGKIACGRADIEGDPIVVVLIEAARMPTWQG